MLYSACHYKFSKHLIMQLRMSLTRYTSHTKSSNNEMGL